MTAAPRLPARTGPWWTTLLFAAAVAVSAAAMVGAPAPASAASPGACPDRRGVTVVVDFGALGGGVDVRCAPGGQPNGLAALRAVGYTLTTAATSPGFLCRIDQRPADDPCVNPSPADAYWSYWLAEPGGRWRYSDVGAAFDGTAEDGSVQGWRFSDGSRRAPSVDPPALAAPPSTPATAPPPSPTAPVAGPGATGSNGPGATAPSASPGAVSPAPAGGGRGGPSAAVEGATTVPGSSPGAPENGAVGGPSSSVDPSIASSTTSPAAADAPARSGDRSERDIARASSGARRDGAVGVTAGSGGSGPPTGLLVGGTVGVGLCVAAAFVVRIRRIG